KWSAGLGNPAKLPFSIHPHMLRHGCAMKSSRLVPVPWFSLSCDATNDADANTRGKDGTGDKKRRASGLKISLREYRAAAARGASNVLRRKIDAAEACRLHG